MSPRPPSAEQTAVIIAGASEWPSASQLEPSPQFAASAREFRTFVLSKNGFHLPQENLLDLFDSNEEQSTLIRRIALFLSETQKRLQSKSFELADVIFYFVGHGGFDSGASSAYFLAIKQTNSIDYLASSLAISSLRRVLREYAINTRNYLILDCCFAASALTPYLQLSATAQGMLSQLREAFPPSGTALLCASGATVPAKAKRGAQFTMFSEALFDVFSSGVQNGPEMLSLAETGLAVRALLRSWHGDEAARPEVHSPEQSIGNVADVPLFRNYAYGSPPKAVNQQSVERNNFADESYLSRDKSSSPPVLDELFREFDENTPVVISAYPLSQPEWTEIPVQVRGMLKKLDGLIVFRPYSPKVFLGLFAVVPILMVIPIESDRTILPILYAVLLALFGTFLVTMRLLYRIYVLIVGERIRDAVTLRPVSMATQSWERFPIMDLLREPRTIIRVKRRAFLRSKLHREILWLTVVWIPMALLVRAVIDFMNHPFSFP